MAMTKLTLRSVLYGVDKIPDKWFEKVPGGFFTPKESNADGNARRDSGSGGSQRSKNGDGGRKLRDSDRYDKDRYRSDGRRPRHERSRSSYDGGSDDDDYYVSRDGRRRRKSGQARRRGHSLDDKQREHDDSPRRGQHRDSRDGYNQGRRSYDRARRPPDPNYDRERPSTRDSNRSSNTFAPGNFVAPGAVLNTTGGDPRYSQSPTAQSPPIRSSTFSPPTPQMQPPGFSPPSQPRPGSVGNGYVPYAHLYGQQSPPPAQQTWAQRPSSSNRSSPPNGGRAASPPVAPPPQGYQQNPFAQQAPTAEAARSGAAYTGQPGIRTTQDPRWANGPDPNYSARLYTGYGENDTPHSNSASPQRSSRRENSSSHGSNDSSTLNPRSRSEHRREPLWKDRARDEKDILEPQDVRMPAGPVPPATKGLDGDPRSS